MPSFFSDTRNNDRGHLLHEELHWPDVPQQVQAKLCATVHRCLHQVHDGHADIARRQHLRSATSHWLLVPRHRRFTVTARYQAAFDIRQFLAVSVVI